MTRLALIEKHARLRRVIWAWLLMFSALAILLTGCDPTSDEVAAFARRVTTVAVLFLLINLRQRLRRVESYIESLEMIAGQLDKGQKRPGATP